MSTQSDNHTHNTYTETIFNWVFNAYYYWLYILRQTKELCDDRKSKSFVQITFHWNWPRNIFFLIFTNRIFRVCAYLLCANNLALARGNFLKYNNLHLFVGKQMRDARRRAVPPWCVCLHSYECARWWWTANISYWPWLIIKQHIGIFLPPDGQIIIINSISLIFAQQLMQSIIHLCD